MKKVLVVLVMMGMLVCGCGANSGTDTENTGTGNSSKTSSITEEDLNEVWDSAKEYYEGIEPLEEEVTIRYGDGVGYQLSVPIYIAWKSGALEELGVNLEWVPSSSGPLRVEAIAADEIDLFGSGFAGIAIGCAQGTVKMLSYINDDSVVQKFYVKEDDPLASADYNEGVLKGQRKTGKEEKYTCSPEVHCNT